MSNISRNKGNQTIKFGQLIECNMRIIILEKSYTKCDGETSPRPFSEKLKLRYLWINRRRFCTVCFYCMQSWGRIETKLQTTFFYPHIRLFKKIKRGLGLVSLPHFLHNFWRKIFLLLSINWPSFIVWLPLPREILVNMCIAIVC